jgi:ABC-type molybdate transport system substrate-binding protein
MKKTKLLLLVMAAVTFIVSCSKSSEEAETCEDKNSMKVSYNNTTSDALRVVVSGSLTPQFEPVNPIFTIDLAPGQIVVKEFQSGRYVNTWYNGCPANCTRRSYSFKDYVNCNEYEEKQ